MSSGKVLTSDVLFSLLPLKKLMNVQTVNAENPNNLDTITQTGVVFDMGAKGTKPTDVPASGNLYLTVIGNSYIRFQFCLAWQNPPKILVRSMAREGQWSAWYPLTLGPPQTP